MLLSLEIHIKCLYLHHYVIDNLKHLDMKAKTIIAAFAVLAAAAGCSTTPQQSLEDLNMPIIQTKYTADPSPVVIGDTLYLYTSHDEDDGENFHMKDWLLYTTTDMVNWQDIRMMEDRQTISLYYRRKATNT